MHSNNCILLFFVIAAQFNLTKPCGDDNKICEDGRCVGLTERCPEDPCPLHSNNKCDNGKKCYYDTEKCDGVYQCMDGQDEKLCSDAQTDKRKSGVSIQWWIWIIIAAAVLFVIGSIGCCLVSFKKSKPPATVNEAQGYSGIPMQSASDDVEPQSSPPTDQKDDFVSGNATLEGLDAYETMNAGKTYGQGFQEGCMQFY